MVIGLGDGGSAGDPNNHAQDTTRLLGSMLRIDVLGPGVAFPANPYDIPADNPFAGNAKCGPGANANACPEIYAWGLRNPWRWSFDSGTGDLWLADVDQGAYEEIDIIERGGNYGWRCREGEHDYNTAGCGAGLIDPVSEYSHSLGNSITGGYVYRGSAFPELVGRYVFSDYGSGRFWALQSDGQGGYTNDQLIDTNFGPTSFGVDQSGELYFTDINNSRLRKLVPAGPPTPDSIVSASANRWQEPNVPTNTIDDDLGTRWSCENDGDPDCYIVFDLGSVTRVAIAFFRGDERMALFGLEASLNGTDWTQVWPNGTSSSGTTLQPEPFSVGMQAQYLRYTGQGNTADNWVSIIEFHVFGPVSPAPDRIPVPTLLSDTGCTDPFDITRPYAGLLPYDINALFWSDGAVKDRHIGLPNGTTITRNADDDWEFPNGTVIVKNFRLNGNLVETRHLMRHPDGVWAGYTYEWNVQQTEATRVKGGKTVFTNGQLWTYPSESQCMECHTSAANFALGPETAQLNKGFTYPSTSQTANQLETIDHIMMFTTPLPGPPSSLPILTDPSDSGASASERARAYLHTNCSQCHRPGGPTPSTMDLRYTISLANTNACDAIPQEGELGIANARLIAPGDAARSLIIERANRRDGHGMPPLGSNLVDTSGINLLTTWINGLSSCN